MQIVYILIIIIAGLPSVSNPFSETHGVVPGMVLQMHRIIMIVSDATRPVGGTPMEALAGVCIALPSIPRFMNFLHGNRGVPSTVTSCASN